MISEFRTKIKSQRQKVTKDMPKTPMNQDKIKQQIIDGINNSKKINEKGGGGVYTNDDDHWNFIGDVMKEAITANPITQYEAEIIKIVLKLYNGKPGCCGLTTSGGTESILLSMLSYREMFKKEKNITKPNIVCSSTAHGAFDKACFYFQIEIRKAPIKKDLDCDVEGMRKLIDKNTICLVASAPEFAYGNMDPIEEIASLALEHGIGCHVDACFGSFILPFMEQAGFQPRQKFDFRVKGVTTISCDPHKYGLAPKGLSTVMFRTRELRQSILFAVSDWHGGLYLTPTLAGSRPGNIIAGAWATFMSKGSNSYLETTRNMLSAGKRIREEISKIKELKVLSWHHSTLVSIGMNKSRINPLALVDRMNDKYGWQLHKIQRPLGMHLCMTETNWNLEKKFIEDIKQSLKDLENQPELNHSNDAAIYGASGIVPDKNFLNQFLVLAQQELLEVQE